MHAAFDTWLSAQGIPAERAVILLFGQEYRIVEAFRWDQVSLARMSRLNFDG